MIAKNVRQRLSNIQQSYDGHMDLMIQELDELERLAKIGKAFEDAKNKEFGIFEYVPYAGAKIEIYSITEYEYDKVLKWSESKK